MSRVKYEILGTVLIVLFCFVIFRAWLADHDTHVAMQQTIATVQTERDMAKKELADKLKTISDEAKAINTPAQAIRVVNKYVPIPTPIAIPIDTISPLPSSLQEQLQSPIPKPITIPAEDAVPLAQYIEGCRECQTKLAAAVQDNKQLASERDVAVAVAKGGTFFQRLRRNAKWLIIGVGIGVVAGNVHVHH